jgi:hypothetical protein
MICQNGMLNRSFFLMNLLQMNVPLIGNMDGHLLVLSLMNQDHLNALNDGLFFLPIPLMVLSHGIFDMDLIQLKPLKNSSNRPFFPYAIPIHFHGQLLPWIMHQFINQRYIDDLEYL